VFGVVGRFWRVAGDRVALDAAGFLAFDRPGFAKTVMNFARRAVLRATKRIAEGAGA